MTVYFQIYIEINEKAKYISSGSPKLRKLYVTDLTSECSEPSSVFRISPASATGVWGLFGGWAYLIFGLTSAGLIRGQGLFGGRV